MRRTNTNELKMVDVHDVRDINQTLFLHLIRERQPISRADIAKSTGLRAGTVSSIVNRLIKNGLVYEGTEGPSSGGRPPKYLYVNAESAYVLAIDIGLKDCSYAVSDFNGRILSQHSMMLEDKPEEFLNKLSGHINNLIKTQYPRARFEAVGVSVPGLVDRENGTLVVSPNLKWNNFPIGAILEKNLGLPVFVENDANSSAFSELWYGPLNEINLRTLIFILVVEGVGAGLIINGELHIGSRIGLGGFGHMTIDPHGTRTCSCGRGGCWESYASDRAAVQYYNENFGKDALVTDIQGILARVAENDPQAIETLKVTAEYLGMGIANLSHGLSPETVVIGGEITKAWDIIEPVIKAKLHSNYLIPAVTLPKIRQASVQRPSLFGAIPIALQNCFGSANKLSNNNVKAARRR